MLLPLALKKIFGDSTRRCDDVLDRSPKFVVKMGDIFNKLVYQVLDWYFKVVILLTAFFAVVCFC
jgi:hypothetical protein